MLYPELFKVLEDAGAVHLGVLGQFVAEPVGHEGRVARDALGGVVREHAFDQVFRVLRDGAPVFLRERELALQHPLEDHLVVRPVERRVAAQQDVHDHAARPQVALLVVVAFEHFGGNVVGLDQLFLTVPSFFLSFVPLSKCVEVPKSITLILEFWSFVSKIMFSGLRSLCMMLCLCK